MEHGEDVIDAYKVVQELQQSFDDLTELLVEAPLNVEIQKVCDFVLYTVGGGLSMIVSMFAVQMRHDVYISIWKTKGIGDSGWFHDAWDTVNGKRQKCDEQEGGMHPKNRYRYERPDFRRFVEICPEFRQYTTTSSTEDGHVSVDFRNWDACRELVRLQFQEDFGISWTIPKPHLVPPIANRLNYLCFIHDLISLWSPEPKNRASYEYKVLDIGCGANLVYPLLGAVYFGWSFVGCDVNTDALRIAATNRDANPSISPCIILKKVASQPCQGNNGTRGIIGSCLDDDDTFDACVCNPPFFSNFSDMGQNPLTNYGGTSMEMVYPGGEESFVIEMIQDSAQHKHSIAWFSTMVGKKQTLKHAKKLLYSLGNTCIRTHELVQGTTHRWVISWSFVAPRHIQDMPLPRYSKC